MKRTALGTLRALLFLLLWALFMPFSQAEQRPLWMRYPAISPDGKEIAFSYQGDIYKVATKGGVATRLTTYPAYDYMPLWSPDGKQIAFVSDRDQGAMDIYIMSAKGGQATRVTTHSTTEKPISFSPDGKYIYYVAHIQDPATSVLFPTGRLNELYKVPVIGGRSIQVLPTPVALGDLSKDERYLIYEDIKGFENEWRKHHTSSVTKDIVLYDLKEKHYLPLATWKGEDRNPQFAPDGRSFYFLSEREGTMNLFQQGLSPEAKAEPLTSFKEHPVRFLTVAENEGTLCFGFDGEIYTLRPGGKAERVEVQIINDVVQDQVLPTTFRSGITSASISPDGKQVAFTVRGEVFVTSAEYNTTRRITDTVAEEANVTFGGDNRSVVYASERNGKKDLYIARIAREQDANFPNATLIDEELLIPGNDSEKSLPQFSPDGKEVAYVQDRSKIMIYNLDSGEVRQVTDGRYVNDRHGYITFTWSPDSKWLALEFVDNNHEPFSDIGIVSTTEPNAKIHNLTESGYFNMNPRFVMGGNAIIYSSEQYGMRNHASWGSMNDVMIVFLNREAHNKFVLDAEEYELLTEAEKKTKKEEETANKDTGKEDDKKEKVTEDKSIVVELDNIHRRRLRLTPASSQLGDAYITNDGKKLYYMSAFEGGYDLWVTNLRDNETKLLRKLNGSYLSLMPDKEEKQLFMVGSNSLQRMQLSNETIKSVSFSATMNLNAQEERAYMYEVVRREEKARFYVKDMHGVNWEKLTAHYEKYLPHISNNYDFSEMLSELLGELNVSHTGSGYRASNRAERTAELGLFFSPEVLGEGLRVDEIVIGGPFDFYNSKVAEGDILMAINGEPIKKDTDYFPMLRGKAGKPMLVEFYSPKRDESWSEVVRPISAGKLSDLLYERWVDNRAKEVERLSNGRLGYVHVASMDDASFRRVYSDAMGKYYQTEGLVVDIRYNGGGRLHEDLEVFLSGEKYLQQEVQGKYYCDMPSKRWVKPSVMVMCEADYSNAHGSPWVYKTMGIGKLVGMPVPGTMTSVNWVTLQDPSLYFGIPAVGYKTKDGYYLENYQLEPDIKVPLDYNKALDGKDVQLEAAVKELLK